MWSSGHVVAAVRYLHMSMKQEYETEEEFPKVIRMFSSLTLLPPSEVVPAFETLCDYVSTKQVE